MAEIILDYKATVPSNGIGGVIPSGVLPAPLGASPGIQLANLGIFIAPPVPQPNRVELKGTVGVQATAGTPIVVFRLFRQPDGAGPLVQIFNKQFTAEPAPAESLYTMSFHTIDFNVNAASGFIVYYLTGEVANAPGSTATVTGPVTFTALAIGNLD